MTWIVEYLPEVEKDLRSLSPDRRLIARKAIEKVKQNPLPQSEGGYGKPRNLTGEPSSEIIVCCNNCFAGIHVLYFFHDGWETALIILKGR